MPVSYSVHAQGPINVTSGEESAHLQTLITCMVDKLAYFQADLGKFKE
jgi:hypothetical protein